MCLVTKSELMQFRSDPKERCHGDTVENVRIRSGKDW
jgi:hypothetical protein